MIFEVKAHGTQVATDCPLYEVQPGGLYILQFPAGTTADQIRALRAAAFAPGTEVLSPPATFLFVGGDIQFTEAPADYLEEVIARAQRLLDERRAQRLATLPLTLVESSTIDAIGYEPELRVLRVRFASGPIYDYADVPAAIHAELMATASKGSYLARAIKPAYKATKVAPKEGEQHG